MNGDDLIHSLGLNIAISDWISEESFRLYPICCSHGDVGQVVLPLWFQSLLDGLPWSDVQIFMSPRWIQMFPAVWGDPSFFPPADRETSAILIDCHEIWTTRHSRSSLNELCSLCWTGAIHLLPWGVCMFSGFSDFLPQSKNMHKVSLMGSPKLSVGVNGCLSAICQPYNELATYPGCSIPKSPPPTLKRISCHRQWMDSKWFSQLDKKLLLFSQVASARVWFPSRLCCWWWRSPAVDLWWINGSSNRRPSVKQCFVLKECS